MLWLFLYDSFLSVRRISAARIELALGQVPRCIFAVIVRNSNVVVWESASRRASFMLAPANKQAAGTAGKHVAIEGVQQHLCALRPSARDAC